MTRHSTTPMFVPSSERLDSAAGARSGAPAFPGRSRRPCTAVFPDGRPAASPFGDRVGVAFFVFFLARVTPPTLEPGA
ncbi:hypothetical protein Plo01_15310 [Planobispora longispora]|uniref:Uncharacterized protein n=1 Tax=Planobispora longispora TaxID=28887 RepID=A0A8J3RJS2_9ACTN|nr:hypothetical protein Plo01_15310 [Planobispora longispora]